MCIPIIHKSTWHTCTAIHNTCTSCIQLHRTHMTIVAIVFSNRNIIQPDTKLLFLSSVTCEVNCPLHVERWQRGHVHRPWRPAWQWEHLWPLHQELDISWPQAEAYTKPPIASTACGTTATIGTMVLGSFTISVESVAPIKESNDPLMLSHASLTKDHSISFHPSTIFFGCYWEMNRKRCRVFLRRMESTMMMSPGCGETSGAPHRHHTVK